MRTNFSWKKRGKLLVVTFSLIFGTIDCTTAQQLTADQMAINYVDNFTSEGITAPNYGLLWLGDPWQPDGPSFWLSGWGGLKFFTGASPRLAIDINGNVGIGTTTPAYPLDVNGDANVRGDLHSAGDLISNISDPDIGGILSLENPDKTAGGTASTWKIANMSGIYGNSLQFWAYDNLGCVSDGMCNPRFTIMDNGNVGIGTNTPNSRLSVAGVITAQRLQVTQTGWPDYVFDSAFTVRPLVDVARYISLHKHLPESPASGEIAQNGLDLGEISRLQMQKIEELTLYAINADKRIRNAEKALNEATDRQRRADSVMAAQQQSLNLLLRQVSLQQQQIEQLTRESKE